MRLHLRGLLVLALLGACSRSQEKPLAPRSSAVLAPTPAPAKTPGKSPKSAKGTPLPAASAPGEAAKEQPKIIVEDDLKTEEPEANPYSESVTLKLSVTPQVKAIVNWGAKVQARLEPGRMDTEITRPRGSGPVDLEIKAEGFMPYHTRLYADRNDRIGVRLYRPEEAPNLFGYKRSAEAKKAAAEK